jgi:hypothetical protein
MSTNSNETNQKYTEIETIRILPWNFDDNRNGDPCILMQHVARFYMFKYWNGSGEAVTMSCKCFTTREQCLAAIAEMRIDLGNSTMPILEEC